MKEWIKLVADGISEIFGAFSRPASDYMKLTQDLGADFRNGRRARAVGLVDPQEKAHPARSAEPKKFGNEM